MIVPEIIALAPLASRRVLDARRTPTETETSMTHSSTSSRLVGLLAALRFAWLPAVVAVAITVASADPRGRLLAAIAFAAILVTGFALNARRILTGR